MDDSGNVVFAHSVMNQLPIIQASGAGWVRINFRLGAVYPDWTSPGPNGRSALQQYDLVVGDALARGLRVLGLLSNDSWRGSQADWTAGNAENRLGTGDNAFMRDFSRRTAVVLARHFQGRVSHWQIWNEPNIWGNNPRPGVYEGETFLYPSNFAWLLRHVYEDTRAAGLTGLTIVSGGVGGMNAGGPGVPQRTDYRTAEEGGVFSGVPGLPTPVPSPTPLPTATPTATATATATPTATATATATSTAIAAEGVAETDGAPAGPLAGAATEAPTATATATATSTALATLTPPVFDATPAATAGAASAPPSSGAAYIRATYRQGLATAGWEDVRRRLGTYPLDAVGQHMYVDQGSGVAVSTLKDFLDDVRAAYTAFEGPATTKQVYLTEFGWTSPGVSPAVQAANLQSALAVFRRTPYMGPTFWFTAQDVPEAGIYYGIHTGGGGADHYIGIRKPAFQAYQVAAGETLPPAAPPASALVPAYEEALAAVRRGALRVESGRVTLRAPGRPLPITLPTGAASRTPDQWCRRDRAYHSYLRADPAIYGALSGAVFGIEENGYLDWIGPEDAGCIDWNRVDAIGAGGANASFPLEVIMQFGLLRPRPGTLLWVQDGDEFWRGRLYEVAPSGKAHYVTGGHADLLQAYYRDLWPNVVPVSWVQMFDLHQRGFVGPDL